MTRPERTVLRLGALTDLAVAIPHSLGFHPRDSLVAIALRGTRERLGFTMRHDLMPPRHDRDVARELALRMGHAGARAVVLAVFSDPPAADGALPRRRLVDRVHAALEVPLREAILVADGRVWSYLCVDSRCCPPEGRPLRPDSPGATALAAAHALRGDVVLPDRDALVATTAAVDGVAAASMRQAMDRAVSAIAVAGRNRRFAATSLDRVAALCARAGEERLSLSHDEAADIAVRLHHVRFRDAVLTRLAETADTAAGEPLEQLVRMVARLAQPPDDAPAATVLAFLGYLRGEGVVAAAAAERALRSDPDYSLARLVRQCVERQVDPGQFRTCWNAT